MHLIKLAPSFDPRRLEQDDRAVRRLAQPGSAGYPGEGHVGWNSICLFSIATGFSGLMQVAPYIEEILSSLQLSLRLVRLLSLEPGGTIREHRDSFLSRCIVRLHVPIVSNDRVEMYVGGTRCTWRCGELWYGDFSQVHSGVNFGTESRVHLVLDVGVDDNLLALFPECAVSAALRQQGLTNAGSDLDHRLLERFQFDFVLPADFVLPGTGLDVLAEETPGCVRLVDSELCVFVNEQPLLKAIPVSEESLDLVGLGADARLEYVFNEDAVLKATLTLGSVPVISLSPHVVSPQRLAS